ncbi:MAG TPA: protocatechuate 3,4-dioxygenase subunit alpha [Acidobacteriaceae bacterium]|jgi:protocatechuate 3,4-dioxygenase alpha subunit|nr:protocatechuate 3,4-dioxygenase subunit alpha [Acidobacteriaceae bacterium]
MRETCAGSQTVGPFFSIGLEYLCAQPDPATVAGAIIVRGRVLDGEKQPVPDALLELWYADGDGHYSDQTGEGASVPQCLPRGFARIATDAEGRFCLGLQKPGRVEMGDGGKQAPHVVVLVFARGLLRHLITRMYFPGDRANEEDPVLQSIPARRRATLIPKQDPANPSSLEWDIRLQGEEETVFFAW